LPEIRRLKQHDALCDYQKENSFVPEIEINRASIKFELDHKRGSLAAVLNVMSDCKLNLTKIQSLPN
jgi:prephenate dehydratase